jgi:signal transduction histidine kinase
MENAGEILLNLVSNILDVSKLQTGTLELNVNECDIRKLVLKILNMNKNLALNKGLAIEF